MHFSLRFLGVLTFSLTGKIRVKIVCIFNFGLNIGHREKTIMMLHKIWLNRIILSAFISCDGDDC